MRFKKPMRPPCEAQSLLLPVTQGCSHNRCKFCDIGRRQPFLIATAEEINLATARAEHFFPPDTRIYLAGANPLFLPLRQLLEWLGIVRRRFPLFSRISSAASIMDVRLKTDEELRSLALAGLGHLYIGVDSCDNATLALMNKGYTTVDVLQQLNRLTNAGISYSIFYILGLGGNGKGSENGQKAAEIFNKLSPKRISTTGLTIFPNTPLAKMAGREKFTEAPEREKIVELKEFLKNLKIETIYDGSHYLNPLAYRFSNADAAAKAAAMKDIDETLAEYNDAELELMVNRKEMKSL